MGNSSVKGIKMIESIYPSEDGSSVFDKMPKLKAKLDREYAKGTIKFTETEEEPIDGDLDAVIDSAIKEVWCTYDPKGTGLMDKKAAEKFFKDALQVYAIRQGGKTEKDAIPKGVNSSDAMKQSIAILNKKGTGRTSQQEFEDFVRTYDIEEALGHFLGKTDGVVIDFTKAVFIDVSQFHTKQADIKPVYRDYPDD
ncbi:uncharacterized protein LOC126316455 [Schistocerca gregaria]|uniref:uncharacterized protein LOC126316455 n=1 Tax=Schistocerca gregaria TaxID=7010 RepID=UPI00211F3253|nr:uncharacterized protein LOC126316455 [Schistocerca gregaria]